MAVDYELLQTLVEVDHAPSFAVAAKQLRLSTSAVSQRMTQLEQQLGFSLFERIGRKNRMTPAARELVHTVKSCFTPIDEVISRLRGDHSEIRGVVRIGGPPPFSRLWLRPRLTELKRRYPELLPEIQFDTASVLHPRLAAGEIDLCILVDPDEEQLGFESRLLYTEELVCIATPGYLKTRGTPRSLDDFARHPFIVYDHDLLLLTPWWRAKFGRRAPLPQHHACRVANLDEMLAFAEAGVGLTVLPSCFVEASVASRATVLVEPEPGHKRPARRSRYPIHLAWRRNAVDTARLRVVREWLLE